ncbi:hypothetical protein B0O99DRAFT_594554 [Bisporella sp. PMI_857]|nr:hypothetical protein B0O99DRAFT_594554 [Bisporella sp. PMI_857]
MSPVNRKAKIKTAVQFLKDHLPEQPVTATRIHAGRDHLGRLSHPIRTAIRRAIHRPRHIQPKIDASRAYGREIDCYLTTNPARANEELRWKTDLALKNACQDLWRWASNNPQKCRQDAPDALIKAVTESKK